MKKVIMEATIKVFEPLGVDQYDVGGFEFLIEGKEIPFDFNATALHVEKSDKCSVVSYSSGYGPFFNEFDIDDETFNENYERVGLKPSDITAKFLSKASKINEFYFCPVDYEERLDYVIVDITFLDEDGNQYKVDKDVIMALNAEIEDLYNNQDN